MASYLYQKYYDLEFTFVKSAKELEFLSKKLKINNRSFIGEENFSTPGEGFYIIYTYRNTLWSTLTWEDGTVTTPTSPAKYYMQRAFRLIDIRSVAFNPDMISFKAYVELFPVAVFYYAPEYPLINWDQTQDATYVDRKRKRSKGLGF